MSFSHNPNNSNTNNVNITSFGPTISKTTKLKATIRTLGRLILTIKAEAQKEELPKISKQYYEKLYQVGLQAISEIPQANINLLKTLQECARRDTGVKHLLNKIFTGLNNLDTTN